LDRRGEVPKIIYQEPYQEIVLGQEPGGTILEASLANGIAHYRACGGNRGELARHAMAWAWFAASTAPRWRPAALVPQPDPPQVRHRRRVRHRPPSGQVWRRGLSPGLFGVPAATPIPAD
jgi:hypothetical protein